MPSKSFSIVIKKPIKDFKKNIVVDSDKSNLESIKALKFFGKSKKIAPDLINQL